jgi:hypothetical protein
MSPSTPFAGRFHLPISVLDPYKDPDLSLVDEGRRADDLHAVLRRDGDFREAIEVAYSEATLERAGASAVVVFNGNHRLKDAREIRLRRILRVGSEAEDALPLTLGQIRDSGGRPAE